MATVVGTDGQYLYYNDDSGVLQKTALSAAPPSLPFNSVFAKDYGVTANGQVVSDAVSVNHSNEISSASADFQPSDVGKIVFGVDGSGNPTSPPQGTITEVIDAHHILVSNAATASTSNVILAWGTDDTSACDAAWNAAIEAEQYLILPAGFIFVQSSLFNPPNTAQKNIGLFSDGFSSLVPTPNFDFTSIPGGTNAMFFNTAFIGGTLLFPNNAFIMNIGVFGCGQSLTGQTHNCSVVTFAQTTAYNVWIWEYGYKDSGLIAVYAIGPANLNGVYIYIAGATGLSVDGGGLTQFVIFKDGSYSSGGKKAFNIAAGAYLNSTGAYWGGQGTTQPSTIQAGGLLIDNGSFWGGSGSSSLAVSGRANISGGLFLNSDSLGITINSGGKVFLSGSIIDLTGATPAFASIDPAGVFVDDGTNNYVSGAEPSITAAAITPSSGWGTSGAAGNGVSSVVGDIRRFQFTITAAGSPSPNPTVTIAFPWTQTRVPLFIVKQIGGTGAIAQVSGEATATTGAMTLTWNGTPQAGSTYILQCLSE